MLMMGKSKDYFDPWEPDRDRTDAATLNMQLSDKVKEYACKRNLHNTAHKNMQHGTDPMDAGAVNGDWHEWNCEDENIDAVICCGSKGKSKGKGGNCYNCGS